MYIWKRSCSIRGQEDDVGDHIVQGANVMKLDENHVKQFRAPPEPEHIVPWMNSPLNRESQKSFHLSKQKKNSLFRLCGSQNISQSPNSAVSRTPTSHSSPRNKRSFGVLIFYIYIYIKYLCFPQNR